MRWRNAAASLLVLCGFAVPAAAANAPAAEVRPVLAPAAIEFIAAMQRVRMNLPDVPDSAALKAFPIYDYLVAGRLRRDLAFAPGEELDATIDAFLHSREGQPVGRSLRHQWLASLAQRRRWDWFLPRSSDVTDPPLVCDRLAGRLATGDTTNLAADALAHWSLPQRQPVECEQVTAWLRSQDLLTAGAARSARARGTRSRQPGARARVHRRGSRGSRRSARPVAAAARIAQGEPHDARDDAAGCGRAGRSDRRLHAPREHRCARRRGASARAARATRQRAGGAQPP